MKKLIFMRKLDIISTEEGDDHYFHRFFFYINGHVLPGDIKHYPDSETGILYIHSGTLDAELSSYITDPVLGNQSVYKVTLPGTKSARGNFDPIEAAEINREFIRNIPDDLMSENLILSGHSLGSNVAIETESMIVDEYGHDNSGIDGLILFSPATQLDYTLNLNWLIEAASFEPHIIGRIAKYYINWGGKINGIDGKRSRFDTRDFSTLLKNVTSPPHSYVHAENIDCPVLIFQGDKDLLVPYRHAMLLDKTLKDKKKDSTLVLIEGADHNIFRKERPEDINRISERIERFIEKVEKNSG